MDLSEEIKERSTLITKLKHVERKIDRYMRGVQEEEKGQKQRIEKQVLTNKAIIAKLQSSLINFQFMVSKEYLPSLMQELERASQKQKELKKEVCRLKHEASTPMTYHSQQAKKLQEQTYKLLMEIQQLNAMNKKKQEKVRVEQTKLKHLRTQIQKLRQKEQEWSLNEFRNYNDDQLVRQQFREFVGKKDRLRKIIQSEKGRRKKHFATCIKHLQQIDRNTTDLSCKIDLACSELSSQEIILIKLRQKRKHRIRMHTQPHGVAPKHYYPPIGERLKKKIVQSPKRRTSIASIFQYIGKDKLVLEQDCDIHSLLYA